jgi:hypothetical protein
VGTAIVPEPLWARSSGTTAARAGQATYREDGKGLAVSVIEASASPSTDLAAARRALRILARWMVAQTREAHPPFQTGQNPPNVAPGPPPRPEDAQTLARLKATLNCELSSIRPPDADEEPGA